MLFVGAGAVLVDALALWVVTVGVVSDVLRTGHILQVVHEMTQRLKGLTPLRTMETQHETVKSIVA